MMACNDVSYRYQDFDVRQQGIIELPRLRIAAQKERSRQSSPRRDSLSSSTGDSGYHSDPGLEGEILFSPVDFRALEQSPNAGLDTLITSDVPLPPPEVHKLVTSKAREALVSTTTRALLKLQKHRSSQKSKPPPQIEVTSYPKRIPPPEPPSRQDDIEQWIKDNFNPRPSERNHSIISLSSSGSCEMYSSNNNSEDEDLEPCSSSITAARNSSKFSPATIKTIELILRKIELNLNYAAYVQCLEAIDAQHQQHRGTNTPSGNQSRGNTSGRNNNNNTSSSQASSSNTNKRKSRLHDLPLLPLPNNPEDDDNDENPNKRRRTSVTTTTTDSDVGPRFACPFFKHDPARYRNRRTCPGPGWPTVHRMKEHLYRAHAQPIFCPRCYAMFDSDAEFSSHLRARPCPVSEPVPVEGIDRETLKGLHKRSPAGRLEEEKWRDAYLLLFPEVEVGDVPSPYYTELSPSDDSRRFRRFLLERIRAELYATAERDPNSPIEQRLLRQVAAIIQRCEAELLETFQPTLSSSSISPSSTIAAGTSSSSRRTSSSAIAGSTAGGDASTSMSSISPAIHQLQPSGTMSQRPTFTLPFTSPQPPPPTHTHPSPHLPTPQHPASIAPLSPGTFPPSQSFPPHIHTPGETTMHDMHPHASFPNASTFSGVAGGDAHGSGGRVGLVGTADGNANFDFSSDWIDWYAVFPGDYDGSVDASGQQQQQQHLQGGAVGIGMAEV
ncbi:hypothetical protein DM02DRAFT_46224 [Periconia macrospinosa]|uniref:C2H2-type domain-containing protein n=1 Tax=Periconia macrospinosa TaxID=97972 RepID=A0A2V1DJS3_9PLEO|nr:hypothetical protein DM02DRAFT_46224 [Periconia macrospinosa]